MRLVKEHDIASEGSLTRLATEAYVDDHAPAPSDPGPATVYATSAEVPDPSTVADGTVIYVADQADVDKWAVKYNGRWRHLTNPNVNNLGGLDLSGQIL